MFLSGSQLIGFAAGGGSTTSTFQASAVITTNLTTYTFSSQPLGSGNRKIVVAISMNGSTSVNVSSATAGGVSLTEAVDATESTNGTLELWYADLTGAVSSTGDIVVTFSGATINCGIGIWTIVGAASGAPHDTAAVDDQSSADVLTDTINVPAGGSLIAGMSHGNTSTYTNTWVGVVEDYDGAIESAAAAHSGGHQDYAGTQTGITIQTTISTANNRGHLAAASWGPA